MKPPERTLSETVRGYLNNLKINWPVTESEMMFESSMHQALDILLFRLKFCKESEMMSLKKEIAEQKYNIKILKKVIQYRRFSAMFFGLNLAKSR